MNDDDLRQGFERLCSSVRPPVEARRLVVARIRQRRRRRGLGSVTLALASVVVAAGVVWGAGGDDGGVKPRRDVSSEPPAPEVTPRDVTCLGGAQPTVGDFDHAGYPTFTEMLQDESRGRGVVSVDLESRRMLFLRDDGTAHTSLSWTGGGKRGWYPSSSARCGDADEWADASPDAGGPSPVALDVGHCWVEPVEFAGRTWDVAQEDQFGWGGGAPSGFAASGAGRLAGDVLTYVDGSGAWLTLVPAGHPWTVERGGCR